jgi:hypothetical protein
MAENCVPPLWDPQHATFPATVMIERYRCLRSDEIVMGMELFGQAARQSANPTIRNVRQGSDALVWTEDPAHFKVDLYRYTTRITLQANQ